MQHLQTSGRAGGKEAVWHMADGEKRHRFKFFLKQEKDMMPSLPIWAIAGHSVACAAVARQML